MVRSRKINKHVDIKKGILHALFKDTGPFKQWFNELPQTTNRYRFLELIAGTYNNPLHNELLSLPLVSQSADIFVKSYADYLKSVTSSCCSDPSLIDSYFRMESKNPEWPDDPRTQEQVRSLGDVDAGIDIMRYMHETFRHILIALSCEFAPEGYLLGFQKDGLPIMKRLHLQQEKDNEVWFGAGLHAPFFLGGVAEPEELDEIVNDYEVWGSADCNSPVIHDGINIGLRLFEFGLDHRVYACDYPHRVLIDNDYVKHFTVLSDTTGHSALYKVKYANKKIAASLMINIEGLQGIVGSYDTVKLYIPCLKSGFVTSEFECAMVGAILRDMYVCEEKDKFYSEKRKCESPTRKRPKPKPTVIWLPRTRVHYWGHEDAPCADDVDRIVREVASSNVVGHPRRCANPSPKQLELAKKYGCKLKPGQTFVGPYKKDGYQTGGPDYKSKSALKLLFSS
jgi:hypothetical protein